MEAALVWVANEEYLDWCIKIQLNHIGSMYGVLTYIYHNNQPNPGKYTSPMNPMAMHEKVISFDANVMWNPPNLGNLTDRAWCILDITTKDLIFKAPLMILYVKITKWNSSNIPQHEYTVHIHTHIHACIHANLPFLQNYCNYISVMI